MKCIVCEREIPEIHISGHIFYVGMTKEVEPGYGSSHDLRKIRIGACDTCLTEAEEKNTIEIIKEEVNPFNEIS